MLFFWFTFIFEEIIPFFFETCFYKWVETNIWVLIQSLENLLALKVSSAKLLWCLSHAVDSRNLRGTILARVLDFKGSRRCGWLIWVRAYPPTMSGRIWMSFEGFPSMTPHMDSFFSRRFKKIRFFFIILHKKKLQVQCLEKKVFFFQAHQPSIHVTEPNRLQKPLFSEKLGRWLASFHFSFQHFLCRSWLQQRGTPKCSSKEGPKMLHLGWKMSSYKWIRLFWIGVL